MAFVPNGTIRLLAGVPLDNAYTHTMKYASLAAQTAAFTAKTKYVYEHCTYIRETARIRIPDNYDTVIMCNYLMYQNGDFGNKWFYAFITGVYYINDHATEIEFDIDVMQTWAFDYEILPGFIERNHTVTDVVGENTIPEPVGVSRYHLEDDYSTIPTMFSEWDVVMYATFDPSTYQYYGGDGNNGIWSGLDQTTIGKVTITNTNGQISYTWNTSPRAKLADLVNNHATLIEGVVAIVMKPTHFVLHPSNSITIQKPTVFGAYTPRNKKLLTYPYTKLFVTDGNGGGRDYAFEEFTGNATEAHFFINSDKAPNESITCIPTLYRGIIYDISEAIVMSGFPQCSWVSSSFQSYLANNQSNMILSTAMAGAQIIGGAALAAGTAGAGSAIGLGMVASGVSQVAGMIGNVAQESKRPNQAHGAVSNASFFTQGKKGFEFFTMRPITEEYLIIDQFFDMYGYAIHRVGVPNTDSRPNWNYVKMVNSAIKPTGINGLPASDMRKIESVLNNGVTFWKNMANVGNYSLSNAAS